MITELERPTAFQPPDPNLSYGDDLRSATLHYQNGITQSGVITHEPTFGERVNPSETLVGARAQTDGSVLVTLAGGSIDVLTVPDSSGAEQIDSEEVLTRTRDELLFAPLLDLDAQKTPDRPAESGGTSKAADAIYAKDDGPYDALLAETAKARSEVDYTKKGLEERSRVTEESVDAAQRQLIGIRIADPVLDKLLTDFDPKHELNSTGLLQAIRTNQGLRMAVGMRIRDAVAKHPYSVREGIQKKRPDAPGYNEMPQDMTSKEYVALLVLAMIDGSYKANTSDSIQKSKDGDTARGKHRDAANSVIRGFREYAAQL